MINKEALERLFELHNISLGYEDYTTRKDYEWCYYVNNDYSIIVAATFNYNEPNEYDSTVMLNDNDGISKTFKEGEEMELIKFITTEKVKLLENRALENINKDFQ